MKVIDINLVTEIRDAYDIISIVEKDNVDFLDDSFLVFREMLGVAIMKKNPGFCRITIKNALGIRVTTHTIFYEHHDIKCEDDVYDVFREYLNSPEFMENCYKKFDIFKQELTNS